MRTFLLCLLLSLTSLAAEPLPNGWFLAGHQDDFTASALDGGCGQPRAVALESKAQTSSYGTVMQLFKADPFRGQRLRYSGTLAARDVKGWTGLWMRVDGSDPHHSLAVDNMQNRPLKGTTDCTASSVVLDVPPNAVTIAAGVVLEGTGRVELSDVKFEPVPTTVATTDLLQGAVKLGAPGRNPEEMANELADSKGRIDAVWFNDFAVQNGSAVLHQRNPSRWSDSSGDALATVEGDRVQVKLGAYTGDFAFRHQGDALVIAGTWGKSVKYPVAIRLTHEALDMSWGFYERHLKREDAPQVAPRCLRFTQYKNAVLTASDELYLCGDALEANAPPMQTTVGFLLTGFQRSPQRPPRSMQFRSNQAWP